MYAAKTGEEACPYRTPNLELALGPENYFAVARADYRDDSPQKEGP